MRTMKVRAVSRKSPNDDAFDLKIQVPETIFDQVKAAKTFSAVCLLLEPYVPQHLFFVNYDTQQE